MCVKHESLLLSSAWREFGGLSMRWVTNWKRVAKLATGFMSVRISMLSVFELHELLSVSEILVILTPSSYSCIFSCVDSSIGDFVTY